MPITLANSYGTLEWMSFGYYHLPKSLQIIQAWISGFGLKNHYFQDGSWNDPFSFIMGTLASISKQFNPHFRAKKNAMN
ncbi:MAG: hypothetical protein U5K51_12640 [Flavobacteriaceae bacterium]|nr:hypothetical protein [Flavobacteriaceae bacterium]